LPGIFSAGLSSPQREACVSRILSPPPSTSTCPPLLLHFGLSSLLHAGYPWAPDLTSKQTEQQKNLSPRQGWSGLGGEMGRDLVCSLGQFHFTMMAEKASQDMAIPTLLFDFEGG